MHCSCLKPTGDNDTSVKFKDAVPILIVILKPEQCSAEVSLAKMVREGEGLS